MRRTAVIGLLVSALALVVAAPLAAAVWGVPAAWPVYAAFAWICHQRPERSWHVAGYPLAVCVRCLGLYLGALAGALVGWPFSRRWGLAALILLGGEWAVEIGAGALDGLRFSSGLVAGGCLVPAIWREQTTRSVRNWEVKGEVRV